MAFKIGKSFLFIYTSIMLYTGVAAAESFPPKIPDVVQDQEQVMDASQVKQLSDIVSQLPEKYKIVIIPGTEELSTDEYAKELFNEYEIGKDQLLLVFNMDKQELGAEAGSALKEKGLSEEAIKQTIDLAFVPYAKQKSYMTGLSTTVQKFSEILQTGSAVPAASDASGQKAEEASDGGSSWVYIVVLVIAAAAAFSVFAFMQRRKWNREMDEIENWMDSIEEKLKQLKAEPAPKTKGKGNAVASLIDKVRKDSLPAAEFSLLEAEAMCDRLRFRKAAYHIQQAKDYLAQIDQSISQLQSKLFQTKVTEEECNHLLEEIEQTRKVMERKLDEAKIHQGVNFHAFRENLGELAQWLTTLPEDGEPAGLLEELKERKQALIHQLKQVEGFPQLRQEISVTLDREVQQLQDDIEEMIHSGYRIPREHFQQIIEDLKASVLELQQSLEENQIEGLSEKAVQTKEQIESIYDWMEEIVTKKGMVLHYLEEIPQWLSSFDQERQQLKEELEELSHRYHVQEGSIFSYYIELEKVCDDVSDQMFLIKQVNAENDLELIQFADTMETIQQKMEKLLSIRDEAYIELEELRKGEFAAEDILVGLQAELVRIEQQFRRHNLPGIPAGLQEMMDEAKRSLLEIEVALNEVPLELQRINHLARQAQEFSEKLTAYSEQIFQFSKKAEERIQQTNRYRRQIRRVNELLTDAETAFRQADYEQAYLLAEEAYEMAVYQEEGLGKLPFRKKKA